jgi:hypothetical protein
MSEHHTNQSAGPPTIPKPRRSIDVRRLRPPALIALLSGALMGGLFGFFAGDLREAEGGAGLWPFSGLLGAVLGILVGLAFVAVGLLLYRFIHSAVSGALVMGLFAALAMTLVGGLFGTLVGLLAGMLLGAIVGVVKAEGGLVVGDVVVPARSAASSWWLPSRPTGASVRTPPPPTPAGREAQNKSMLTRRRQV